ncbi:acetylesterase [Treponema sp. OMZ 840]|uniref:alpha/beta hydrolase n=1 Tax=Treponema sp. OMZ 840 TaxID=244313 RepID=UPI003D91469E
MAVVYAEFFSHSLMRSVPFCAVIPAENPAPTAEGVKAEKNTQTDFKTLYLLHGLYGSNTDWLTKSDIRRLSSEKNLAVIMPAAENHFYMDGSLPGEQYGRFIGEELPEIACNMFCLSKRKEDTFIAGLSMGGAGAIRTACLYPHRFSAAAGLSSAFLNRSHISESHPVFTPQWADRIFGGIENMEQEYKNAVKKLIASVHKNNRPTFYLSCGTEDFLLEANRDFHRFCTDRNIEHVYEEKSGGHDWQFWNGEIKKVIDRFIAEKTPAHNGAV